MAFELVEEGRIGKLKYKILNGREGLNGYITYPKRPVKETGYGGIVTYIPVHGGITFAKQEDDGSFTYGFDTAHCNSNEYPRNSTEWIKGQLELMVRAITLAKKLEDKYLLAEGDNEKRGDIVQKVIDLAGEDYSRPLGVNINLICGKL